MIFKPPQNISKRDSSRTSFFLAGSIEMDRKLLAKELKELGVMCKRKFYNVIPVKAKVGIKLDLDATDLGTHDSTCDVQIEFPKFSRNLGLFAFDDEESLSSAGIHIATQAKGLLPELDKHLKKLENLQKIIIKRIKEEAKKHYLPKHEMDEFLEEVMG